MRWMAKALKSFKDSGLSEAISRRIKSKTYGLGFWAAVEASGTRTEHVAEQKKANPPAKVGQP